MNPADVDTLWMFVRGDLSVAGFEAWLYPHQGLEAVFGRAFHLELISANYQNPSEIYDVRQKLDAFLRPALKCECVSLADTDVVPMGCDGLDKRFFATVDEIRSYGRDLWWLHLSRCSACGQNWMIAQEERIYDDHMLKRLRPDEALQILEHDKWPNDFLTYEKVLGVGQRMSKACRFFDPMSFSLIDTVRDLRQQRPDITVTEMARLLGIDNDHVIALLQAT